MGSLGSSDSDPVNVDWQWRHYVPSLATFIVVAAILFAVWQVFRTKSRTGSF